VSRQAPDGRRFAAWLILTALLAPAFPASVAAQPVRLPDAPACTQPARLTPKQTEGPYYKAGSPRRHNIVSGRAGERIVLTGYVLSRSCRPIPGAVVEIWQTDARGAYDNAGFDLRGHELTDAQGRYWFETVVPGTYSGRTAHIHVKVRAPGQPVLTTQLYLPGEQRNARDNIFNPALVMNIEPAATVRGEQPMPVGRYDFVVDVP
jgi:protocatechuate 3,4-dioxygenase beta subunit